MVRARARVFDDAGQEVRDPMIHSDLYIIKFPIGLRSGEECALFTDVPD